VAGSLDHLIRPEEKRRREREAKRLGRLEVDDQLECSRLLDGEIGGFGALENLVDIGGGTPIVVGPTRSIGQETADLHELLPNEHSGHAMLDGQPR